MKVLGISVDVAISSACLIENGHILMAIPEERLSRNKLDSSFPIKAIKRILEETGTSLEQIDEIVVPWNPILHINNASSRFLGASRWRGEIATQSLGGIINGLGLQTESEMGIRFDDVLVNYINHHDAHFANAYYLSGFTDAVVLTVDGKGEEESTVIQYVKDGKREVVSRIKFPHSIGMFYAAFTEYLGFKPESDEWKVMAIGALNNKRKMKNPYFDIVRSMVNLNKNGYELDLSFFSYYLFDKKRNMFNEKFERVMGGSRLSSNCLTDKHILVAEAVQLVVEEVLDHLIEIGYSASGVKHLSLSGGVAMNSLYNGRVLDRNPFMDDVFVSSCPDDSGVSVGAALWGYYKGSVKGERERQRENYWGTEYSDNDIKHVLHSSKVGYQHYSDDELVEVVTDLLINKKLVGWFQGRMEFGQRALGNRSIIASPVGDDVKDLLNSAVKFRESFRPFAPAILKEKVGDFFDVRGSLDVNFMEKVFQYKNDVDVSRIPVVVHDDKTGRLQSVDTEINPLFYKLVHRFYEKTGVPILVNTSFNQNGEPVVESPLDALRSFYSCGLDCLAIGGYVVEK